VRAGAGAALAAMLGVGLQVQFASVEQHVGDRPRTRGGEQLDALRAPALRDAVVFVDSPVIPAAMTLHPGDIDANHPIVVKDNGDAANAGFLRLHPRPAYRLVGLKAVPLKYAADAPVRNEGGALYPLEIARGGFGDRVSAAEVWKLPLSNGDALRFRAKQAGASFSFRTWAPEDVTTLHIEAIGHKGGPAFQVSVDGGPPSPWTPTDAAQPATQPVDVPVRLGRGEHEVTISLRESGAFFMDYAELRR
jgi:hypothetical protein